MAKIYSDESIGNSINIAVVRFITLDHHEVGFDTLTLADGYRDHDPHPEIMKAWIHNDDHFNPFMTKFFFHL